MGSLPTTLILQQESSFEIRAALSAAYRADDRLQVLRCTREDLGSFEDVLKSGEGMAIGSVEYVLAAFSLAGVRPPLDFSYPEELRGLLKRDLRRAPIGEVLVSGKRVFLKPVATKQFTGFLHDPQCEQPSPEAKESLLQARQLSPSTEVWACAPVKFLSEYRYYVADKKILGFGRYDLNESDQVPAPDQSEVSQGVSALRTTSPLALDFGVLDTGETVLVEANDFWGLGLYSGAITESAYLSCLRRRWAQLMSESANASAA